MAVKENGVFRYNLGEEFSTILNGKKLKNHSVKVRPVIIRPGSKIRAHVITEVSDIRDINHIGEIYFDVQPKPEVAIEHETFVTVESGIRSGLFGQQSVVLRSFVDRERMKNISLVRERLLGYWSSIVVSGGELENDLLIATVEDMNYVRTLMRKYFRYQTNASVDFVAGNKKNPRATAARLTAAIVRMLAQLESDRITKLSLKQRHRVCVTISETIESNVWDIQNLAVSTRDTEWVRKQVDIRLNNLCIKPYFWAVMYVQNTYQATQYGDLSVVRDIAHALLAEQTLGSLDMLFSDLKRSDYNGKKQILRIITMSLAQIRLNDKLPEIYKALFADLQADVRRQLSLNKAVVPAVYEKRVKALQEKIRNRPQESDSEWFIANTKELFDALQETA